MKDKTRVAGVGGILCDSRGKTVATYTWGLGQASNNQAKSYALLHGLLLAKEAKVRALIVIRDSSVVIKAVLGKISPLDSKLAAIIAQAKKEASIFRKTSHYHVE